MTTSNVFRDRLTAAAQEGYMTDTRRTFPRKAAKFSVNTEAARPAFTDPAQPALCTPRAAAYAKDLLTGRCIIAEDRPKWYARMMELQADPEQVDSLTADQCSALIEALKALPAYTAEESTPQVVTQGCPEGRYAVEINGELIFAKIDCPTEGRWAGYTFIKRQVGGEFVRIQRNLQEKIKRAVAVDPRAAAIRYGLELGVCACCGRELTNEESRAAGIGPVCRAKYGW